MPTITPLLPEIRSYGSYSGNGYGAHCLEVRFPNGLDLFYSYSTIVAFAYPGVGRVVRKNIWGPTTGKHLNWIGGYKNDRLDEDAFTAKLHAVLLKCGMATSDEPFQQAVIEALNTRRT